MGKGCSKDVRYTYAGIANFKTYLFTSVIVMGMCVGLWLCNLQDMVSSKTNRVRCATLEWDANAAPPLECRASSLANNA